MQALHAPDCDTAGWQTVVCNGVPHGTKCDVCGPHHHVLLLLLQHKARLEPPSRLDSLKERALGTSASINQHLHTAAAAMRRLSAAGPAGGAVNCPTATAVQAALLPEQDALDVAMRRLGIPGGAANERAAADAVQASEHSMLGSTSQWT